MHATVAERGQVTVPKRLRERLGVGPHTVLDFREENGRLVAEKVEPRDPVGAVLGCLKLGRPVDRFVAEMRGKP
jgi:antitoxin PrlF